MRISKYVLIIIIIGFAVYFNSLFNGFVWDDEEQVVNNVLVHSITNFFYFFGGSTFNTGGSGGLAGIYYKPMMSVGFSLLYSIFGSQPFFFHFFQLVLHLSNASFVFLLFRYFFSKKLAFLAALFFLVHPFNTETVVYISALQDTLFFFFGILSLYLIFKQEKIKFLRLWVIALLLLLSLLSKETGLLFLLITLLFGWLFKRQYFFKLLSISTITFISYLILRFPVGGVSPGRMGPSPIMRTSIWERLVSLPQIVLFYLQTFFAPLNLSVAQHWLVKSFSWQEFYFPLILVFLFFILVGILGLNLHRHHKKQFTVFLFFCVWFILGLGLHLQLFPLDMTVADRWFYFPMVGLIGMIATVASGIKLPALRWQQAALTLSVLLLILLSIRVIVRNLDWKDGLTLYKHDIQTSQGSFDLENNLGVEYYRSGQLDLAEAHFYNSTLLAPHWWTNWNNLGVIVERKGDYSTATAYYQKAIDNGGYYLAYQNLANILLLHNNPNQAADFALKSLRVLPFNAKLWMTLALAEYKLGEKQKALQAAYHSYQLAPDVQNTYIYTQLSKNQPLKF